MADEVEDKSSFNIDDYIMSTDEGSGELVVTRKEPIKQEEIDTTEQQVSQPDKFVEYDNRFSSILDAQNRQSNALGQLIQYVLNQGNKQQGELDQEQLGEVFTDADKGAKFLSTLTKQIETIIDSKMQGIQPLVQNQQLEAELKSISMQPDFAVYAPAMYEILGINGGLSFTQAYQIAKQKGWKSAPQKQVTNKGGNNNVVDINQPRNLPDKLESSNAQLKSKQVSSIRDALEQAYEELTGS